MDYIFGRQDFAGADAQQETFLLAAGTGAYCALSTAFSATRGDHALLMACLRAPTARFDLVHRLTETLAAGSASVCLSTQDKADGPDEDGWRHLVLFDGAGPRWVYEAGGIRVTRRVAMAYGANTVAVQYTVVDGFTGMGIAKVAVSLSLFRKLLYFLGMLVFPALFGAAAVFYAEPVSDLIACMSSSITFLTLSGKILGDNRRL